MSASSRLDWGQLNKQFSILIDKLCEMTEALSPDLKKVLPSIVPMLGLRGVMDLNQSFEDQINQHNFQVSLYLRHVSLNENDKNRIRRFVLLAHVFLEHRYHILKIHHAKYSIDGDLTTAMKAEEAIKKITNKYTQSKKIPKHLDALRQLISALEIEFGLKEVELVKNKKITVEIGKNNPDAELLNLVRSAIPSKRVVDRKIMEITDLNKGSSQTLRFQMQIVDEMIASFEIQKNELKKYLTQQFYIYTRIYQRIVDDVHALTDSIQSEQVKFATLHDVLNSVLFLQSSSISTYSELSNARVDVYTLLDELLGKEKANTYKETVGLPGLLKDIKQLAQDKLDKCMDIENPKEVGDGKVLNIEKLEEKLNSINQFLGYRSNHYIELLNGFRDSFSQEISAFKQICQQYHFMLNSVQTDFRSALLLANQQLSHPASFLADHWGKILFFILGDGAIGMVGERIYRHYLYHHEDDRISMTDFSIVAMALGLVPVSAAFFIRWLCLRSRIAVMDEERNLLMVPNDQDHEFNKRVSDQFIFDDESSDHSRIESEVATNNAMPSTLTLLSNTVVATTTSLYQWGAYAASWINPWAYGKKEEEPKDSKQEQIKDSPPLVTNISPSITTDTWNFKLLMEEKIKHPEAGALPSQFIMDMYTKIFNQIRLSFKPFYSNELLKMYEYASIELLELRELKLKNQPFEKRNAFIDENSKKIKDFVDNHFNNYSNLNEIESKEAELKTILIQLIDIYIALFKLETQLLHLFDCVELFKSPDSFALLTQLYEYASKKLQVQSNAPTFEITAQHLFNLLTFCLQEKQYMSKEQGGVLPFTQEESIRDFVEALNAFPTLKELAEYENPEEIFRDSSNDIITLLSHFFYQLQSAQADAESYEQFISELSQHPLMQVQLPLRNMLNEIYNEKGMCAQVGELTHTLNALCRKFSKNHQADMPAIPDLLNQLIFHANNVLEFAGRRGELFEKTEAQQDVALQIAKKSLKSSLSQTKNMLQSFSDFAYECRAVLSVSSYDTSQSWIQYLGGFAARHWSTSFFFSTAGAFLGSLFMKHANITDDISHYVEVVGGVAGAGLVVGLIISILKDVCFDPTPKILPEKWMKPLPVGFISQHNARLLHGGMTSSTANNLLSVPHQKLISKNN